MTKLQDKFGKNEKQLFFPALLNKILKYALTNELIGVTPIGRYTIYKKVYLFKLKFSLRK